MVKHDIIKAFIQAFKVLDRRLGRLILLNANENIMTLDWQGSLIRHTHPVSITPIRLPKTNGLPGTEFIKVKSIFFGWHSTVCNALRFKFSCYGLRGKNALAQCITSGILKNYAAV